MSRAAVSILVVLVLLSSTPLALATHASEQGPPASTSGWLGGFRTNVLLDVVPQEITPQGGLARQDFPTGQRLRTEGSYDCESGLRSAAPGSGPFSFDVVPMNLMSQPYVTANWDDHLIPNAQRIAEWAAGGGTGDLELLPNAPVYYTADLYLGYGAEQRTPLFPGLLTFFAFMTCNGAPVDVLPREPTGPAPRFFGFLDESEFESLGEDGAFRPEFEFHYLRPATDRAGLLLPGDTRTAGWYLGGNLLWDGSNTVHASTFRWVVNPSLTAEYPGYTGSRFEGIDRRCLLDNGPSPTEGGTFGNCGRGEDFLLGGHLFNPPAAPATEEKPAPLLEDVDVYGPPKETEPVMMETLAAGQFLVDAYQSGFPDVGRATPSDMEGFLDEDYGAGWRPYFDVERKTGFFVGLALDPLYTYGVRDTFAVYPTVVLFEARLGLARDANRDGVIAYGEPNEFFGVDDALATGGGPVNWGDVGEVVFGNDVLIDHDLRSYDFCTGDLSEHSSGQPAPASSPAVALCNEEGEGTWGTFDGDASNAASSHGWYRGTRYFITPAGSTLAGWTVTVDARIRWPDQVAWASSGVQDLAGVVLPFGVTVHLTDVDHYVPAP